MFGFFVVHSFYICNLCPISGGSQRLGKHECRERLPDVKHVETSQCHNSVITKTQHDLITTLCGVDLSVADVFSSIDAAGTVFLPSSLFDEVFICVRRGK